MDLEIFNKDGNELRAIEKNREPWFVGKDVCDALEFKNSRDALSKLDDFEKDYVGISDAIGRMRKTTIINESGIYSLIFRSTKPEAKKFKRWVTEEVLPSIRKTGSYQKKDHLIEGMKEVFDVFADAPFDKDNKFDIIVGVIKEKLGYDIRPHINKDENYLVELGYRKSNRVEDFLENRESYDGEEVLKDDLFKEFKNYLREEYNEKYLKSKVVFKRELKKFQVYEKQSGSHKNRGKRVFVIQ